MSDQPQAQQQPNKDEIFASRIQSGIATVEAWDDDPSLLAECRLMIPFNQLLAPDSPYQRDEDCLYANNQNMLFLKRLAVHFQKDAMTWVNAPPCHKCGTTGDNMQAQQTRPAETLEEQEGQARRVEVYKCKNCNVITTFPRYNSCRKLLETRQGRCGEYANLFGLYCRAVGFETRYVSDWTDHVWVEVLIGDEWVMADGCEGTIHSPSMYEHGWGKKLNYIVAISSNGVTDVTPRYTRKFYTPEFQERRRQITSSEAASDSIVQQFHRRMRQNVPAKTIETLNKRDLLERIQLEAYKNATEWTEAEKHGRGRISGSLEWRLNRNEAGNLRGTADKSTSSFRSLKCEQFYPTPINNTVWLEISSKGIEVTGVLCDTQTPHSISVVVVDDAHLGCVLQSRSFTALKDVADFLQNVPLGRIVAIRGSTKEENWEEDLAKSMEVLGGFKLPEEPTDGVAFLGRLGDTPEWAKCVSLIDCKAQAIAVEFPNAGRSNTKLRTEAKTVPSKVVGRLPESAMPLQTQMMASEAQKRTAFLNYAKDRANIIGYTTKDSTPVYLIDNSCFPFQDTPGNWSTFHFLPEVLVPDNDNGAADNNGNEVPKFDLPLEEDFFQNLLGPSLLVQGGASVPTVDALRHTRLVGLYFSAHWCPPCKRFTPMLAELYSHLKEEHPYHGLEIVFVTSDRSQAEFQQYFATMPWKAVPFDETRMRTQGISMQYGVRGIPALVILDAVSGQVVSTIEQTRNEVTQACSRGDSAIEDLLENNWLQRLPPDSKELFNLLELSSKEGEKEESSSGVDTSNAYLARQMDNPWANGDKPALKELEHAPADKTNGKAAALKMSDSDVKTVLTTMLKYLDNALKTPWNPKFRQFKLSNKVVDKVMRLEGAISLMSSYGIVLVPTAEDFMVSIPLACDLEKTQSAMRKALEVSD